MGQIFSSRRPDCLPQKSEPAGSSSDTLPEDIACSKGISLEALSTLTKAKGHYYYPNDGPRILDACGGAGVACIGHGRKEIIKAAADQMKECSYVSYAHFKTNAVQQLSEWLIESTGGAMQKVYLLSSGSEAVEAALKLSREYHIWRGEPQRVNFISRSESYHGTSTPTLPLFLPYQANLLPALGSLSASGHHTRRAPYSPLLSPSNFHKIPPCNPYRQPSSSPAEFLDARIAEVEAEFQRLGPNTVAAVIVEPIVGAALGCVAPVPHYLSALRSICHRHGALLIFDEVMCGMSRTGTLHAWQSYPNSTPDMQTIAKGFAGGYLPASALLVGSTITSLMTSQNKTFTHGHTYQNHPVVAAVALRVQKVVQEEGLLRNVQTQGRLLERLLRERLGRHRHVGDIRGKGLFWGVEFVKDRETKEPFEAERQVAMAVFRCAMKRHGVLVYAGQGCAGEGRGDHIMVMPAYDVTSREIGKMVEKIAAAVEEVLGT
ncbi:pyridoxal phosphate-dependent transferase [Podospora aff. communis PSN243]|uniref:Pyridoxal phosphate-dependent transferase n=1 Tax=Podospora aff. communis PSN243 TaxID=3040156 RepID=A0AAV9H708_9PEZI|nr:pyridoxal phosphate-dependent transferase [Podospora aff. communis PSN243]